ncbi:MAG: EamA family transporter [Oscillospiraceae bacterium]|nr:EamA family transporter [Oscillospiraceae bacterium]
MKPEGSSESRISSAALSVWPNPHASQTSGQIFSIWSMITAQSGFTRCITRFIMFSGMAGWQVNTGSIVQSAIVSVALLFAGFFLYREALTWNRLVGTVIGLIGLVFINLN